MDKHISEEIAQSLISAIDSIKEFDESIEEFKKVSNINTEEQTPRVQMDFTITDQYGNMNHVCKDTQIFEEFDGDGLDVYCEAFKNLLIQVGYIWLEGKEIEFIKK